MNRTIILLTVLVCLVPLLGSANTPTPAASGIEGMILVSPSRPGPLRKDGPSTGPARNIDFVVKKGDVKVGSFTTNLEGAFRILLPPGHYTVTREDPGAAIGHWRFEVDVLAGQIAKVTWTGDSGMR
jgi:hypothetical protein